MSGSLMLYFMLLKNIAKGKNNDTAIYANFYKKNSFDHVALKYITS